ncbi:unnamed protein product [Phytophthora lilii]|uniref:Unnamed protein product n=1 Tax=Phytophthora lilii TaxID=2077276 RepID=A0A9W6XCZ1_9STRA|nr:unnamed protein product [Phytophthora lilii]
MDHNAGVDVVLGTDFMIPAGVRLDLFNATAKLPDEVMVPLIKTQNMIDETEGSHVVGGPTELYDQWLARQPSTVERPTYTTPTGILERPHDNSEGDDSSADDWSDSNDESMAALGNASLGLTHTNEPTGEIAFLDDSPTESKPENTSDGDQPKDGANSKMEKRAEPQTCRRRANRPWTCQKSSNRSEGETPALREKEPQIRPKTHPAKPSARARSGHWTAQQLASPQHQQPSDADDSQPPARAELVQNRLKIKRSPDAIFKVYELNKLGDKVLTSPQLAIWKNYLQAFNKENPTKKTSLISAMSTSYGDDGAYTILQAAKQVAETKSTAKKLEISTG